MPNISRVKRCYHCGAILQHKDANQPGYISSEIIDKYPDGLLLCDECYKSEKQNAPQEAVLDEEYLNILETIKAKKALVVYVVDLFSFEGSFIRKVNDMLNGCDVLAIGNKRDLLPKNVDDKELLLYIKHRLRVAKLDVKDVVLTSSTTGYNIDLMYEKIKKLSVGKDVYFVGASISGKSALIAEFLKKFKNNTNEYVVTYTFPNTNLRGFKIPLGNHMYIYETPGLSIDNSMLSKVDEIVAKKILPDSTICPKSFKLNPGLSLMFGGLALIELISGEETKVDVYCKTGLDLKVSKNGEARFVNVLSRHTLQPCCDEFRSFADFDVYDFEITEVGDRDIGILGLGWFHFIGNKQTYRVFVPKGVYVYTTRSKIKKC